MRQNPTTLVVGAGIAGLGSALLASRERRVVVVEGEPVSFGHSSGRNAAIFRPLESSVCISELVLRSEHLLTELGAPPAVLDRCGLLLAGGTGSRAVHDLSRAAVDVALAHQVLDRRELARLQPALLAGNCEVAVFLPNAGVLNLDVLHHWLRQELVSRGVELRTGAQVAEIRRDSGRVRGITLADGEQLGADQVVIAAGAWSEALGASCGCPVPLRPHRRHLAAYDCSESVAGPAAWNVDDNVYFRGLDAGHAILACPGDETPHLACLPEVDAQLMQAFPERLARFAPQLGKTSLVRAWACLRTSAPDWHPVVGADPRLEGLFWLAGLGGVGMSAGLGCAQQLAGALEGAQTPEALSPARWLQSEERSASAQAGL